MVGRGLRRALDRLDDVRGRRQVGIADAHVDQVDAAGAGLALVLVDLREQVGGQLGETVGEGNRGR
jgi:hypothetical protein